LLAILILIYLLGIFPLEIAIAKVKFIIYDSKRRLIFNPDFSTEKRWNKTEIEAWDK
jgi:hypothetical protein